MYLVQVHSTRIDSVQPNGDCVFKCNLCMTAEKDLMGNIRKSQFKSICSPSVIGPTIDHHTGPQTAKGRPTSRLGLCHARRHWVLRNYDNLWQEKGDRDHR